MGCSVVWQIKHNNLLKHDLRKKRHATMSTQLQFPLRTLGKTDIQITPIGLGMMEFAGGGSGMMSSAFPTIPQEEKNATVKAALEGGINWFDTAELYGAG